MDQIIDLLAPLRLAATGVGRKLSDAERDRRWRAVYDLTEKELRLFVFGVVPPDDAQDVLQETWRDIAKSLGKFTGNSNKSFRKWCRAFALHKILDYHRKRGKDPFEPMDPEEVCELAANCDEIPRRSTLVPLSPPAMIDLKDRMKLLAVDHPVCYGFLYDYYYSGMNHEEIAVKREMTIDAVEKRVLRCWEMCRSLNN